MTLSIITSLEQDDIFARVYIKTGDPVQAATQARVFVHGYDIRDVAIYNLERPETKRAIVKAQSKASAAAEFTRDSIVTELQEISERALNAGEFAPAITAKKTQAQLLGYLDQNITVNVKHDVTNYTDAQLEKMLQDRSGVKMIEGEFSESKPVGLGALTHTTTP